MRGAVFAAIAATMGNLLQGWDNATIAGIFFSSFCVSSFGYFPDLSFLDLKI